MAIYTKPVMPRKPPNGSVSIGKPVMPRKPGKAAAKGMVGQMAKGSSMTKTPSAAQAKAMKQKQDLKKQKMKRSY